MHRARRNESRPVPIRSARLTGWLALVLLVLLGAPALSAAIPVGHRLLYDVDFESPMHTVGQAAGVDAGSYVRSAPSRVVFGDPMVVAAYGALDDQPLLFAGNASTGVTSSRYDQIQFDVDGDFSQVAMAFDLLVPGLSNAGTPISPSLSLFVDRSGGISRIDFLPNGTVRHWNAALSVSTLWFRHRPDRVHHYELLVDLVAGLVTLVQDDVQHILALGPTAAGLDGSVRDLRLSSVGPEGQPIAALDNVVISAASVPEPGTALLLALGLAMSAVHRRRAASV